MRSRANINLELSKEEKGSLRKHKAKISKILDYSPDEIEVLLNVSDSRAKEIFALADFQQVPSIGIKFAKDLISMGFYSMDDLQGKTGAELTDLHEKHIGYKTDPCVEDQFRLIVYFAKTKDYSKNWWDFTTERKAYRAEFGYPKDRLKKSWTEVL
jgi:hypothetical protein